MKIVLSIFVFITGLMLYGCSPKPDAMAEKYMALVCADEKVHLALTSEKDEDERIRLEGKSQRIQRELEKLNTQILAKFQGNETAMEEIQKVCVEYTCEEE